MIHWRVAPMTKPSSYPLRMPDETRAYVESKATENNRSLQGELLSRIQVTVDIERVFAAQVGSLDELVGKLQQLLLAEKRNSANQATIESLNEQLLEQKALTQKLIKQSSEGFEGKQRNIQRVSGKLAEALDELNQLFPTLNKD